MDPKDRLETIAKTKASARQEKADTRAGAPGEQFTVPLQDVEAIIESWPAAPKKVAEETIRRYGPPNEATPTLLIWHRNGQWKRTEITSDETIHNFPTPHTDYITQKIDYHVPVEKLAEVGAFDGSVIVYRTAGEVAATCDNEAANLIPLNLVHDIVQGTRTVEEARKEFAEQTAAWTLNRPAPYAEKLQFRLPAERGTADPDEAIMKESSARQTVEKAKDVLGLGDGR